MSGRFFVVEGIDLSGKSTLLEGLKSKFGNDENFLFVADPGSTQLGLKLREILKFGVGDEPIDNRAELLLFTASRAQLCNSVIAKALDEGKTVICDRFLPSTLVYQGMVRGGGIGEICEMHKRFCGGLTPNVTFFFKIPYDVYCERKESANRENGGADRFENVDQEFTFKVMAGYDTLIRTGAQTGVGRSIEIDGTFKKEEIVKIVSSHL